MASYTLSVTTERPYEETVKAVRAQLVEQGFGVLTEIDLRATMRAKLDVEVPAQVILGACRPQLAHQALSVEPSIAALLPCNVVVRSTGANTTVVEAFDPAVMTSFATTTDTAPENGGADDGALDAIRAVSDDARTRLLAVLAAVATQEGPQ